MYHRRIGLLGTGTKLLVMVSTIQLLGNYCCEPKGEKTNTIENLFSLHANNNG